MPGAGSRGGKVTTKQITRGKNKGKTVQGRVGQDGKFRALNQATSGGQKVAFRGAPGKGVAGKNTQKGNARAGMKFARVKTASGQEANRYIIKGKVVDVVTKGGPKPFKPNTKSPGNGKKAPANSLMAASQAGKKLAKSYESVKPTKKKKAAKK